MRNKRLLVTCLATILVLVVAIGILTKRNNAPAPKAYSTPSQAVLSVIDKYLQARENSIGVDQSSPSSWLSTIKPLVTQEWFMHLQPAQNPSTSSIPYDYTYAHQNGYIIRATTSNCYWQGVYGKPTSANGTILCSLTDKAIDQKTGKEVPASSLEFGWVHTGQQPPPILVLIKQGSGWLISEDDTGQGH